MRNEYLSREPIEEGLNIPVSVWQEIEDYWDEEPLKALQYIMAVGRYCFFGDEPTEETTNRDVLRSVKAQLPLIDKQRIRYRKAQEGGKSNRVVSDEEFIELLESRKWSSQAELGRELGISRQAISQRLKRMGRSLAATQPTTPVTTTPTNTTPATEIVRNHLSKIIE